MSLYTHNDSGRIYGWFNLFQKYPTYLVCILLEIYTNFKAIHSYSLYVTPRVNNGEESIELPYRPSKMIT